MSSCNNKEQAAPEFYMGKLYVYIEYVNVDGTNILQNDSQIEVYYEENGIAQRVIRQNLDVPFGFTITTQSDAARDGSNELCVKVSPSDYLDSENISTTYVKFGDKMDTIQCQFYKSSNTFYLLKTWHNGTLVWDKETAKASPLLRIIK